MALRPANEDQVHHAVDEVRVYLDDLTDLVANLTDYGPIQLETTHQDGERSLADTIDDLAGRTDIWQVTVSVLEQSGNPVIAPDSLLVVDLGTYGVSYIVHHARPDLRRVADHFIKTLERARRPWWKRVRRSHAPYSELVLDRRRAVREASTKKRHDYRLALVSGGVGAVLGALATALLSNWVG